jgi:puromycin-sensitive aminopeptidase
VSDAIPYRLPDTCVPVRYDLHLEPDLHAGRFAGRETVALEVRRPTSVVVLNAAGLAIHEVAAWRDDERPLAGEVDLDPAAERASMRFPEPLTPGRWQLRLRFEGVLDEKLRGFYRSRIRPASGAGTADAPDEFLAVTQFEATEARRAFPCWDEPAFKAVFHLTVTVPEGRVALGNSRAVRDEALPDGRRLVAFAPTIPMSTYLVALVVGRLEATPAVQVGATPLRIWCVPGKRRLAAFALDAAAFSLRFFEEYYGLPYPGDKLDLIAIPDFAFGAMENLGAVTFRETALLVDPASATHAERARVADVVAHELAHMWFGDLVTMAWWNGLWLNEAFATFMEVMAVDAWRPAWERWASFGASRGAALAVDGLHATRPVEFAVAAPRDADAMFDVLTYEKGGAVLRMLEQHLRPPVFRDGVRRYLQTHRFGNADTVDLWRALGAASAQPIPEMMDGWIFRPGYPLVSAQLAHDGESLLLAQERFQYLPAAGEHPPWHIPVAVRAVTAGRATELRHVLTGREGRIALPAQPDWVVVNAGGHGFYRVRYAADLLQRLLEQPGARMEAIERFNLVNDAWALTLAGQLPLQEYLDLTARFREETDRNAWAALLASFAMLQRTVPAGLRNGVAALVRDRVSPAVRRLGWSPGGDERELTRQLRGEMLRAGGTLGEDPEVQAAALRFHERHGTDPAAEPNVLTAAIAIVAHLGGQETFEIFLQRFRRAGTPQEEQRYLYALAAFRDPDLVRRTLAFTLDGTVRTQDAPFVLRNLLLGVDSRELAWAFVQRHWDVMAERYPESGLRRMCEGLTGLATPRLEAEVRAFVAERKPALGGKVLEQYLEQLRVAVTFGERAAAPGTAFPP